MLIKATLQDFCKAVHCGPEGGLSTVLLDDTFHINTYHKTGHKCIKMVLNTIKKKRTLNSIQTKNV